MPRGMSARRRGKEKCSRRSSGEDIAKFKRPAHSAGRFRFMARRMPEGVARETLEAAIMPHAHHRPRRLERLGQDHAPRQGDPPPRRARASRCRRSSTPITASTSTSRARIPTPIARPARPRFWSARRTAGRWCTSCADEAEPALAALLAKLSPVDLVLVEGYKREPPSQARSVPCRGRQAAASPR